MAALVSLDSVKRWLKIDLAVVSFDEFLNEMIAEASDRFGEECEQPIQKTQVVHEFRGNGKGEYSVPFSPVSNLSRLEQYDTILGWIDIDSSLYRLQQYTIVVPGGLTAKRYRATIDVGFDTIPLQIVSLIRREVVKEWLESPAGKNRVGISKQTIEAGTDGDKRVVEYDLSSHEHEWEKLVAKYRRVP